MDTLELDAMYESAYQGDDSAISQVIEAIGNDDESTVALINLLNIARYDESEEPFSSPTRGVRNGLRLEAFHALCEAVDSYHKED